NNFEDFLILVVSTHAIKNEIPRPQAKITNGKETKISTNSQHVISVEWPPPNGEFLFFLAGNTLPLLKSF
ncbi:hypothetical protein, partial [Escherichia coli]|uniref:hypothetical protein n=1 Tax=Escherichia coli TaxID=562 RepID=UPI003EE29BE0